LLCEQAHVPTHLEEALEETGLKFSAPFRLAHIFVYLIFGLPLYLIMNAAGRDYGKFANHFDPYSPIFSKRERMEIVISDAGLIAVISGLTMLTQSFGWLWLMKVTTHPPPPPPL
jgi:omega-6 fatty acid desaturase (delta-12 desaturase)